VFLEKYIIPEISAYSIISCAKKTEEGYKFNFDTTDPSKEYLVKDTLQDNCPIFYQAMLFRNKTKVYSKEENKQRALRDVFIYVDFSGIFDRAPSERVLEIQKIAEYMFRPEGITFYFDTCGYQKYIAFERSASMSRECKISFVREDFYDILRERMTLGMEIGECQLSKLYAYNALLFTSGERSDAYYDEESIIVVKNPKHMVKDVLAVTAVDDGTENPIRKYSRIEKTMDFEITEFDGEGMISPAMANSFSSEHSSFQIRMPYIKGVVHKVDFASLFTELGIEEITDLWGNRHNVNKVHMILTESMFKGIGWMTENGLTWAEYLARCRKYDHAIYLSGTDKLGTQKTTELNYQFLNTLALTDDEFRPKDLPFGWNHSPEDDGRNWVTKTTESTYYDFVADEKRRLKYFTEEVIHGKGPFVERRKYRRELLKKNSLFINEPIYTKELDAKAESILKKYSHGKLLVAGDNRYLSDDLLRLCGYIIRDSYGECEAYKKLEEEFLKQNDFYAPKPGYGENSFYTLLRNPHITRNEEAMVYPLKEAGYFREKYFSHLGYVAMIDSRSAIQERLGGADYDGDMVKTIADPLINNCVRRSSRMLPVLKIPAAKPLTADANDWYERFITVKNTFSSRVGQISNCALRRGIIAYDENSPTEERERFRKDVEMLTILTGLEIDSAKSGIKPDLSDYIGKREANKSLFLRFKNIDNDNDETKWYEPTKNRRLKEFFEKTDWESVTSNLEKLPYYALMLSKETEKIKPKPQVPEKLFIFAEDTEWKEKLDPVFFERVKCLIEDYETALKRAQYLNHIPVNMKRKNDVYRILFSRGQENEYSVDRLYAAFEYVPASKIREARRMLDELKWHLTPPEERQNVLDKICNYFSVFQYRDVLCDFRNGGYRILGDIIADFDDMHSNAGIRKHSATKNSDSENLKQLLNNRYVHGYYREDINERLRHILMPIRTRDYNGFDCKETVKCAVALGKLDFVLEIIPFSVYEAASHHGRNYEKVRRYLDDTRIGRILGIRHGTKIYREE